MARRSRIERQDPLMIRANALRAHLPQYLQFRDDTSDDPEIGLEPDEVEDAYGMTESDYG